MKTRVLIRNLGQGNPVKPRGPFLNTASVKKKIDKSPKTDQPVDINGNDRETRTTVNNGYLGSCNDEERSEARYVV